MDNVVIGENNHAADSCDYEGVKLVALCSRWS